MIATGSHDLGLPTQDLLDGKAIALSDDGRVTILRGGTVLDGLGGRLDGASVVIRGQTIESIVPAGSGSTPDAEPTGATVIDATGATILPGLIDAHIHFMGKETTDPALVHLAPSDDVKFLRAAFELYQVLASGFTTVRALGHGPAEHAYALRQATREGLIHGPRLLTCGWALSQTRGHGDVPELPYEWVEHERPRAAFVDGELECRRMVRRNFGEGADVIKVYASDNRTGRPDFTVAELTVIAEEAHRRGRRVATHAKTYEGVRNALAAGIDTIEHGPPEPHDDLLSTMRDQGSFLIPTLATVHRLAVEGPEWGATPATIERAKRELDGRMRVIRTATERGVRVATGSDAGARSGFGLLSARELGLLVEAGLSPLAAISAATSVAAAALGLEAEIGSLEPGKLADIIIVEGDLTADVRRLEDRRHVRHVLQAVDDLTNVPA